MLTLYQLCFLIGGSFTLLSALAGFDGADIDSDWELDREYEVDPHTGNAMEQRERGELATLISPRRRRMGLPILKLRFWTFGSCFFGLTGLLLSRIQPVLPSSLVLGLAIAIGIICGTAIVWALHSLRQQEADSLVRSGDLAGLSGIVEIPFDSSSRGKVRVNAKGMMIDFTASTQEAVTLVKGERVVIVGVEGNRIWVVSEKSFKAVT
ncbi:MAG: NfeD-like protein [Leptolyngbyaceae cyanobacterium RM2_2_4]|nr:NfeD-like protein [Leptolyngbyaceae cyanobacterium SM1_4_3]NJO49396.1 NfeD-like protein [Leptolyngbyaceae cyanobacterium RM2_2_4]NJO66252.1 NfeD-like protein [Leptolyngbyaceae cyanobacterium RM1_405_57]